MRARRNIGHAAAALALATAVITSGCGVEPSGVEDGGEAPTGLAEGTPLFFLDGDGRLQPTMVDSGRLGTVLGAVQLLMAIDQPSDTSLHSEVPSGNTRPTVEDAGDYVTIRLPYAGDEISPAGIDQVICTATAVVAVSGREIDNLEISVLPTHGDVVTRSCPALD
ncbi:hypothetical protein [Phytoactinopolyspora endophytica]|uniref:hypothetical protein n=1 Tax=Phytoactinopolyspora endophytica TaxID=1642495 RepID=UPI00101D4920|nr:hypothetical protein [Phytoactinopolyspora endophytica]